MKLAVVPQEFSVAVVTFPSIRDAASAAAGVMRAGVQVAAMEIMDEVQMKVVNLSGSTAPRRWRELPTLFFKFSGTKASVKENISMVSAIAKAHKGGDFEFAKDAQEQKLLWSARKESLWSMLALRKDGTEVWSTDVAVPFSRLADIIEVSKKEMDDLGLFASILGHIGDGNFHESIMYDRRVDGEREKVEKCVKNMVNRALEMEGTCTVSELPPRILRLDSSWIGRTRYWDWKERGSTHGGWSRHFGSNEINQASLGSILDHESRENNGCPFIGFLCGKIKA